ncbi:dimethyl sulfoxide reductase anchor subunit [Klebsiella pneumoniae]|uniref:DmsC/YnfH family molybdoenzyme membrane anchor subunit n=1 Tax=Klebsiella pneumoniae TaxID=573 RepID=UPI0025426DFF|nr:DmsC/YnfH family molybdoenzyme membrane anchor subunit [Klebsiella pneumoniae]WIH67612.1 dimethyl sulfoxide reductase anchor subunit [Klebsiella pneumoniae]HBS5333989.1 dimethyl sulfoxide reductase anchor subunit [Klebsiella pneumoniae]
MGNGWHEWPLMVFTVFGQCVVGGFIVLALALMTGKLSREQELRVVGSMFGLWVLMGIGFIASTMHLGSPLRAFNSLNRMGASSLSNEIASGAIFFAVGGIGWLLALALACWCVPQIRGRKPAVSLLGLAFVLILAGEMIGRGVFYGLHMTVGMAVAS